MTISNRPARGVSSALAMLGVAAAVHGQTTVIYVDDDAPDGGNGASWSTALRDLQSALSQASQAPGVIEVRIGQGTYRPAAAGGDPNLSFQVTHFSPSSAVTLSICGGFAGLGTPDPHRRDIERYRTVLSGDLRGDDGPDFSNRFDNSYCVVRLVDSDQSLILDGLTVEGGYSRVPLGQDSVAGAGITIDNEPWWALRTGPVLRRCTVSGNFSMAGVAGIDARARTLRLDACTIASNMAPHGPGGLRFFGYDGFFADDCSVIDNTGSVGGGLSLTGPAALRRCTIARNHSTDDGGGVFTEYGQLSCQNSLLADNSAVILGGAVFCQHSGLLLDYCTVIGSSAAFGGAVFISDSGGAIRNSILWGNSASSGESIAGAAPLWGYTVRSCAVESGRSSINAPFDPLVYVGNVEIDPLFRSPSGTARDYRLAYSSPCVDRGDGSLLPDAKPFDRDGLPRFVGDGKPTPRPDMGCYEHQNPGCPADFNSDGFVDPLDYNGFINAYEAGEPFADVNRDGFLDPLDYEEFLWAFEGGC